MPKRFLVLFVFLAPVLGSCSKQEPEAPPPRATVADESAPNSTPEAPLDACTLLTNDEIQAVTGESPVETKSNRQAAEGLTISQCYFSLPTASNSITLRLVQPGAGEDARSPRAAWRETYAGDLKAEGREAGAPQAVAGVGDEAYWTGGGKKGGLYVLKGDRHFRLGVGGEPSQEMKIERARQLATSILSRL